MKVTLKSGHTNKQKGGEKKMKHSKIIISLGVGTFVLASLAFLNTTLAANENVRATKHNLSASRTIDSNVKADTTEVCIFCHTPHGGGSVAGSVDNPDGSTSDYVLTGPLWNRNNPDGATFTQYSSPTLDLSTGTGKPRGISLACLSCHDGVTAFDSLSNFSGSGSGAGTTFTFTGSLVDTSRSFADSAGPYPNLGQDLSNDHPITVKMCESGGTNSLDDQFDDACGSGTTHSSALMRFPQRTNGGLPTDHRDRIRLYKTDPAGGWYVECASCHNPHESGTTRFLRYPAVKTVAPAVYWPDDGTTVVSGVTASDLDADRNKGSLLCLSCHAK